MSMNQYAAINRELIWAALFAWLQGKLGATFRSMGRKHIAPPDLTIADQPALFQVATKEVHLPKQSSFSGLPVRVQLDGVLIVYFYDNSPDENIGGEQLLAETTMNNMLMAIDAAFTPDIVPTVPGGAGKFTLGGLVTPCWVEGDTNIDPGIFGPQCAAILPIHILV
jgi:hypothetical protein